MAMTRRNKIIIAVVAVVVGIPLIGAFAARENFFLMRFSEEPRVNSAEVKPLDESTPTYADAVKMVADNAEEVADSKTVGKMSIKADLDGDDKKDKFSGAPDKINIKFTKSRAKYRHRLLMFEKLSSLGLSDLDGNGETDAWFTLGNKGATYILWNDGEGDISGKQTLTWDNSGKVADAVRTAFFDVDKDGVEDLVIERGAAGVEGGKAQYSWLKLEKGGK